jgi:hypothetical protein
MASTTEEAVVEAAKTIDGEFTRDDVAGKLGIERSEMKPSWKAAKDSGKIEKVGQNSDGENLFKVAG